jgi:glycosyltransferase involved in cell wall biosynthesis
MPTNQLCILEVVAADIEGMGGVETYLKQLNSELLAHHNVRLHVVYPTESSESTDTLANVNDRAIHFHPIKMVTHGINKGEFSGNLRRMIAFRKRISDVLERNDIDVVTLHAPYDAPVTVASGVSFRHGIPLVVVYHGGEQLFQGAWNPLKLAGKALAYRVIKRADKRAGVSLAAANCRGDDSVVLGSLCDTTRFDPAMADAKRFKDELGVTKE